MPAPCRTVAILGIDNFSRKNRPQVSGLNVRGYVFDVFTNDTLGDSERNLPPGNTLHMLAPGGTRRVRQVVAYLQAARRSLHHVEVYPAGRFAAVYVGLARLFEVPVMTVERGDLLYRTRYSLLTRLSMDYSYRQADVVWYREPYQDAMLARIGTRRRFFLPNAVELPHEVPPLEHRFVDFAWVNRLIPERRADWVAEVLGEPPFSRARAVMYGLLENPVAPVMQRQEAVLHRRPPNLEVGAYADPAHVYATARFFLLPSEVVFCNHALLEAMAHGVVPLVSDVEDARRIVDDGVNGFVFPHTMDGLRTAMARALALPAPEHARMSAAAVEQVKRHHAVSRWCDALEAQYNAIRPGGASRTQSAASAGR